MACGSQCEIKSDKNCKDHYADAAEKIIAVFKLNRKIFDPTKPKHIERVGEMLKTTIKDEDGKVIPLNYPEEEPKRKQFLAIIHHSTKAAATAG